MILRAVGVAAAIWFAWHYSLGVLVIGIGLGLAWHAIQDIRASRLAARLEELSPRSVDWQDGPRGTTVAIVERVNGEVFTAELPPLLDPTTDEAREWVMEQAIPEDLRPAAGYSKMVRVGRG